MGPGSAAEPSEEIRLARATLVGDACAGARDPAVLVAFADDFADIIASATRDPFHDVKKAAHAAVEAFVEGLARSRDGRAYAPGAEALRDARARALCASALPDARHRHSQVRLSCLRAVSSLVPFLGVEDVEALVAPGVSPMCADRTPGVRLALHEALAHWIVGDEATPPRAAEGDARRALPLAPALLPMLLAGAADASDAVAARAARLVETVGEANERRRARDAAMTDEKTTATFRESSEAFDVAETNATAAFLPPPFRDRLPGPGSRRLVASLLHSLLPLAVRETREWTAARRNAGARLLGVALVYARERAAASPLLPRVIDALVDAAADDDRDTAERALVAAGAIGAYAETPERSWVPLLVDVIAGDVPVVTRTRRAAALVVAAAAIRSAPPARITAAACRALADGLASEVTLGCFGAAAVRAQCLSAASNLIAAAERSGVLRDGDGAGAAASVAASASLFRVLLRTLAAESPETAGGVEDGVADDANAGGVVTSPGERGASSEAMASLARARGFSRVDDLYLAHAKDTLASALRDAESEWDGPNPSQRAFCAFFLHAPVSVFAEADVADATLAVFASAGARARDPSLRAAMLRAMDAAFEEPLERGAGDVEPRGERGADANRGGALVGGVDARATAILETVVLESLVWRAGAAAAAARYAAIVCLGTMLRRSLFASGSANGAGDALLVSREALVSSLRKDLVLAPVFSAMEEDRYAETRRAACHALDGVLATAGADLGDERRRSVYPEILKRMDDGRDEIRVAAARSAWRFFRDACPADWDETNCLYFLKPFVVHMDDPNEAVRDAALEAALEAARVKPSVVAEVARAARETHRHAGHVERALEAARRVERERALP